MKRIIKIKKGELNVEQFKKDSIRKSKGNMDRLVCDRSSRLNSLDSINAYSFWNQPNTTRFGYWGSPMASSGVHKQVHNGQNRKIDHCIQCGCYPKPDEWSGETSRLCIDCGDR